MLNSYWGGGITLSPGSAKLLPNHGLWIGVGEEDNQGLPPCSGMELCCIGSAVVVATLCSGSLDSSISSVVDPPCTLLLIGKGLLVGEG